MCCSKSARLLELRLHTIEQISERNGLSLNKLKCELIRLGSALESVHFVDGSAVPVVDEAKYLGCVINDRTDPRRELRI
eukprot:12262837-Prorocentrum_lima.AAC.1